MSILWAIVLFLASVTSAHAFTCDDAANTCTYRATVTEPTKTTGGVLLGNYKQTNFKAARDTGSFTTISKPATAPSGGGTVFQDYIFPTPPCVVTTFTVKASGVNTLGIEGPDSAPVTVARDRTLDPTCAPQAPAGLKVE